MEKRIVLIKGKQKKLIESVKNSFHFTWRELADEIQTGENYLRFELRNEKRLLDENKYKKLCKLLGKDFDKFIKKKLNSNWGQIKGGKSVKARKNLFRTKRPTILGVKSSDLAEIIGIMIGDGSIYVLQKKGIYQVHVAGNLTDESDYLLNYVKPLFEKTFKIQMNIKKAKNGIYVWKQSKDLVFTLNKFGLPIGNKKLNKIKIPAWVLSNKDFLKSCIRGIFDTDGTVYPKNKTHIYPTIWISSAIPSLQKSITQSCNLLGLNLSKWKISRNDAYLRTKKDVFKFYNEISFNNPKHIRRWKMFNKLPSSSSVNSSQ